MTLYRDGACPVCGLTIEQGHGPVSCQPKSIRKIDVHGEHVYGNSLECAHCRRAVEVGEPALIVEDEKGYVGAVCSDCSPWSTEPSGHYHRYRSDISDWWCDDCDTVTDYCTELGGPGKPADGPDGPHPADCAFCAAGEPMQHNYEPPKEDPSHG